MEGALKGTTIQDLKMEQYDNLRRMQEVQNINYNPAINNPYNLNDMKYHYNPTSPTIPHMPVNMPHNIPHNIPMHRNPMEDLVKDINAKLPNEPFNDNTTFNKVLESYDDQSDHNNVNNNNDNTTSKTSYWNIPNFLKDPLLILVLYIFLSLPIVKNNIGKYIKQINPDESGNVSIVGIIIYGTILAVLFILFKRFLLKGY